MIGVAAGVVLIVVPIAFNAAFFTLGRIFEYPDILRRPPGEVLERFRAGGTRLLLAWWVFMLVAAAFIVMAPIVGAALSEGSEALAEIGVAVGVAAGLVQAIGLSRWPFAVPELARRHAAGDPAEARMAELQFAVLNRLLGVGIGEHLGYLLTGVWTILVGAGLIALGGIPAVLGVIGLPIGLVQVIGSLEFVGSHERDGWRMAGIAIPIAYVAWSIWLIAVGVVLLLSI